MSSRLSPARLATGRSAAAAAVLAGAVRLGGPNVNPHARPIKPGLQVPEDVEIETAQAAQFVSRGGTKLANALSGLDVAVAGRRALDVGASTGGFTDCLLQQGAAAVTCVDVAYGELAWSIRSDERVTVIERQNARELTAEMLPYVPDLVVADVSFISLTKLLPALRDVVAPEFDADAVAALAKKPNVRVLETGYFAPMLSHRTIAPDKEWADHISADLITPHFTISEWEAIGRRLRANYLWIFMLLALSWTLKVYIHPSPIPTTTPQDLERFWSVFVTRATGIPAARLTEGDRSHGVQGQSIGGGGGAGSGMARDPDRCVVQFRDPLYRVQHDAAEKRVERGAAARKFPMAPVQAGLRMGRNQPQTQTHHPPLQESPQPNAIRP